MNIETYDRIIDSTIRCMVIFALFVTLYACIVLVIILGWMILTAIWPNAIMPFSLNWIWSFCLLLSAAMSFFSYSYCQAKKLFIDDCQFRDFWMAWGTSIKIYEGAYNSGDYEKKILEYRKWAKENKIGLYRIRRTVDGAPVIIFLSKEDAMGFKLKWT